MNIGIVTQPLIGNFGGILQNYALQQILIQLGHNPITIDLRYGISKKRYILRYLKYTLNKITSHNSSFLEPRYQPRSSSEVDLFIKKYIKTSSPTTFYHKSLISKYKLEALIVGSDQVWRPAYNVSFMNDMFLAFAKNTSIKRIAYAASYGTADTEYSQQLINELEFFANKFDAISVRELSGIKLTDYYFKLPATKVLDPTLLLSANTYLPIIKDSTDIQKYIFCYILDPDSHILSFINRVQKEKDIPIKIISDQQGNLSPSDWIKYIRNAEFVITDSFHGTVFSIIFHKQFITFCNANRGADRFISLLSPLSMNNRILTSQISDIQFQQLLNATINWESIDAKLEEQRTDSINFLKKALN